MERRNDVGGKILVAVASLLLGVLLTVTFSEARGARSHAYANEMRITALEANVTNVAKTVNDFILKMDNLFFAGKYKQESANFIR